MGAVCSLQNVYIAPPSVLHMEEDLRFFNRKYLGKYFVIVTIVVVFILILRSLIFNLNVTLVGPLVFAPFPTEENPNFLMQVNKCFLPTAAIYKYDLRITASFRSMSDQTLMYDQGRTINGHIVSEAPPGHSLHNYGYAVDVVDRFKGYNIDWTRLIKIAAYCSLESGGPGDLPHFEYRGGLSTDDFAVGRRPTPLTLPCAVMAERTATATPLTLKDLNSCGAPKF
jgi:hypothetical protein